MNAALRHCRSRFTVVHPMILCRRRRTSTNFAHDSSVIASILPIRFATARARMTLHHRRRPFASPFHDSNAVARTRFTILAAARASLMHCFRCICASSTQDSNAAATACLDLHFALHRKICRLRPARLEVSLQGTSTIANSRFAWLFSVLTRMDLILLDESRQSLHAAKLALHMRTSVRRFRRAIISDMAFSSHSCKSGRHGRLYTEHAVAACADKHKRAPRPLCRR